MASSDEDTSERGGGRKEEPFPNGSGRRVRALADFVRYLTGAVFVVLFAVTLVMVFAPIGSMISQEPYACDAGPLAVFDVAANTDSLSLTGGDATWGTVSACVGYALGRIRTIVVLLVFEIPAAALWAWLRPTSGSRLRQYLNSPVS